MEENDEVMDAVRKALTSAGIGLFFAWLAGVGLLPFALIWAELSPQQALSLGISLMGIAAIVSIGWAWIGAEFERHEGQRASAATRAKQSR